MTPAIAARLDALLARGERRLLGIVGPPGSGKSTLAAAIRLRLGDRCALAPMDGFHLAQAELVRLGRADRKGAPDTFDVDGFVALLRRLRARGPEIVYAPVFRREIEEPIAAAIAIGPTTPLVVIEGNYLLLDGPWSPVRGLLDEAWFLDVADDLRDARLLARHLSFGRSDTTARAWIDETDSPNALLIEATRHKADWVVT